LADTGEPDTGDPGDTGDYDTGEPEAEERIAEGLRSRVGDWIEKKAEEDEDEDITDDTGSPLGPSTMPQATADDFSEYQQEHIYGREGDAGEAAYGDLDNRLNNPEDSGTISSSSHPNWRGTGHTMHEVVGEDMTRYFLESPDEPKAFNITGHPDAGRK
jgi:hypothetical protein